MVIMRKHKNSGYTLLELGLVLVVLSLVASGILTIATQKIRAAKLREVEVKMDTIERAVFSFRKANGYVPCPGDITLLESDQNFGFKAYSSVATAPTCQDGDGSPLKPNANFASGQTVGGMVPVRTLGLPDEYARDPWNGKFFYVVDKRITSTSTFNPAKLTDTTLIGSITVNDQTGSPRTSSAALLIMSFGPNGHGAYLGTARKFTGSTNADEWENCDCNASITGTFNSTFVAHPSTGDSTNILNSFDDIVRYYSRTQLISYSGEGLTESR
jgi:type II secretory pathway pseudopilin PulG